MNFLYTTLENTVIYPYKCGPLFLEKGLQSNHTFNAALQIPLYLTWNIYIIIFLKYQLYIWQ